MCSNKQELAIFKPVQTDQGSVMNAIQTAAQQPINQDVTSSASSEELGRRVKLWELETELHCSVIGTCIPVAELKRIYRRLHGKNNEVKIPSDYELHNLFVHSAVKPHAGIKMAQKYLERTYKATIQRYNCCKTEAELMALWEQTLDSGEIAAGYWALLTHAHVTPRLVGRSFSEVHMLSHLSGRNYQAEKRRRLALSSECKSLRQQLTEHTRRLQRAHTQREQTLSELRELQTQLRSQINRNQSLEQQIGQFTQQHQLPALQQRIRQQEQHIAHDQQIITEQQAQLDAQAAANTQLQMQLQMQQSELNALTQRLDQFLKERDPAADKAPIDLCGCCILYVGGHLNTRARFRNLVEHLNGRYLHHDGGLEDGRKRLPVLLQRADAVFCPLDCVSHNAVGEIKALCQREAKPVVLMRSASLAAFNAALCEIAS